MPKLRLIVFTKYFQNMDIVRLIEAMKFMDSEGADLCVRPGYPVNPENVQKRLPEAVKKFEDAGLSIPLVTTPGDFVDPKTPEAERLLAACGEAGVKLIKLGYWFMEKGGYGKTVEKIRNLLEDFVKLARRYEVKVLIHNHSGALLSLCWAKAHGLTLMVQDLTNPMLAQIPHVLLAAYAGTIMGVETNSMQFYPEASKAEAEIHPGIYRRRNGKVNLSTIKGPGFGYCIDKINRKLPEPVVSFGSYIEIECTRGIRQKQRRRYV